MEIPTLPGVQAETVTTDRIKTRVLFAGPEDGEPVVLLHGNITSATWWEEVMLSLPRGYRGIAPDQRGYGDADPEKKIDATKGTGDLVDDVVALMEFLAIDKAHLVGNSMGGSVLWRMLMTLPERFLTATLVAPGSPYGFGGTRDTAGTPCHDDFAGSGGGLSNPELLRRLAESDRSLESQFSPRAALRALVFKPPFVPVREEDLLSSTLKTHLGPLDLPGGWRESANWPYKAPGDWGLANAVSPKFAGDISALNAISPKPNVLWIRGSHDLAVSDRAASCPGALGAAGLIPDWPGPAVFPPQPMLGQTRAVLERYQQSGGRYQEVVIEDTAHVPFLENLPAFNEFFHGHLTGRPR